MGSWQKAEAWQHVAGWSLLRELRRATGEVQPQLQWKSQDGGDHIIVMRAKDSGVSGMLLQTSAILQAVCDVDGRAGEEEMLESFGVQEVENRTLSYLHGWSCLFFFWSFYNCTLVFYSWNEKVCNLFLEATVEQI